MAVIAAMLLSFVACSTPGGYFNLLYYAALAWAVLGFIWVIRLIGSFILPAPKSAAGGKSLLRWALAPILFATTFLLLLLRVPLHITFALSQPAMRDVAAQAAASPQTITHRRWIGLFPAGKVEPIPGGVRFLVGGSGWLDPYGFAYSPSGPPPRIGEDFYEPFRNGWYIWRESW